MSNSPNDKIPLVDAAAVLLDCLRAEPVPEDERPAVALRKATQAAFALLEEVRKLTAEGAPASAPMLSRCPATGLPAPDPASTSAPDDNDGGRNFFGPWTGPAQSASDRRQIEIEDRRQKTLLEVARARPQS